MFGSTPRRLRHRTGGSPSGRPGFDRPAPGRRSRARAFRLEFLEERICLSPVASDDFFNIRVDQPEVVDVLANDYDFARPIDRSSIQIVSGPSEGSLSTQSSSFLYTYDFDGSPVGSGTASGLGAFSQGDAGIELKVSGGFDTSFGGSHSEFGDYTLYVRLGVSDFSNFDPSIYDYSFSGTLNPGAVDSYPIPSVPQFTPYIAWIDNTVGAGAPDTILGAFDSYSYQLYTPDPGFVGSDSFQYTVQNDLGEVSNVATAYLTVAPNQAPVANDDVYTAIEGRPNTLYLYFNDYDPDGFIDTSSYAVVTPPTHGTVTLGSFGEVYYAPDAGYTGPDSFTYTVNDNEGVVSNVATVSLQVQLNEAPVAADDSLLADAGLGIAVNGLLANDFDPNGDFLNPSSISVVTPPSHGTIAFNNLVGALVYTPDPGYLGTDGFQYTIDDGYGGVSNVASVAIVVQPTSSTLTSPTSGGTLPSGVTPVGGLVLDLIGVNGVRVVSQLAASSLYVGFFNDGTPVAYRGNPGTIGIQTNFSAELLAALGGGLAEAALRVTLYDGDTGVGDFDDQGQNFLLVNGVQIGDFSDVPTVSTTGDGEILISRNPGGGFRDNTVDTGFFYTNDPTLLEQLYATLGGGSVTYQVQDVDPYDNFFDFTQGVDGGLIDVGTLPNSRPIARDDAATTPLNTPIVINPLANDIDVDGTVIAASVVIALAPSHGTASVDPTTGAVTYTPNADFSGSDTFRYTVRDDDGAISNEATVTVNVLPLPSVADVKVLYGGRSYSLLTNTQVLPWTTINAISFSFNSPANLSIGSLSLTGINVANYPIAAFAYDPSTMTATWTLDRTIGPDRLVLSILGDEVLRFNVLPGDFDQDGVVTIMDSRAILLAAAGNVFADLDGDGDVDLDDVNASRRRFRSTLPPIV
ncbi:Ig-like domain-containing protein [Paludisphaera mucosa]|uniref:Ig-like domain-containing protein n=1 Tax=Paludisphaera mucosa TaxID=3030827 RepID=A0ABT6FDP9_9BACT|nr:Ig-like domain-containing protein [Paludisphaera mucosa]MDG3005621.1 Ig-like domain-containing protein [Paludisphaera mucosa]